MLKLALSHDVDRTKKSYQYLTGFLKSISKGDMSNALYNMRRPKDKEPYWNVYDIAALEDSYGVRSTFFMLDESIKFNPFKPKTFVLAKGRYDLFEPKIQEAIRYLDKNGWEIGLHGSYLSYNNKALLAKEKARLESIVGHPVIGTRQHHLNMDDTTWKIHEELGFEYDSTWGFNDDIGIKEGRIMPFHPNNSKFVVFPMTVMDMCFMRLPSNRWDKFHKVLDEIEENNAVMVVNYHHRVYDEREYPGFKQSYARIIETVLKRNGKIGPLIDFYNAYNAEKK
ncbi:MAG TPA: polysaccharide deacetylase family protein [Bacteroidia bacterium]|nr:polysaccharide deacetylase family protein [Bacteroidia bacterium]HRG53587.1 polysaccharide deacetylase family protein [Bacteroidia bacterium]